MSISAPAQYPNVFSSSALSPTPAANALQNPISIEVPLLQNSNATFTPKSKLTPDQHYVEKYPTYTNSAPLYKDDLIKITHKTTWETVSDNERTNRSNVIKIETGEKPDVIKVNQSSNNEVQLQINDRHYTLKINNHESYPEELHIKSKGGDDHIRVNPRVTIPITIEGGKGRDRIEALGSGDTRVYGGAGNDNITLGSGNGYAEGNDGNDTMKGGSGIAVMYGNNGNDTMSSGTGSEGTFSYMDGGNGNDTMVSESPMNVMHGGPGDDLMTGKAQTVFYTGRGRDRVNSYNANDTIYAKKYDLVTSIPGTRYKKVNISNAGHKALKIEGSSKFKQQTQDDLEFFRNSPTAQKMLSELDRAAERNGSPITIRETTVRPNYTFTNNFTREHDKQLKEYDDLAESPQLGFIHGNTKGSVATGAKIHNNPGLIFREPPVISLYHEMAHAYNGANGTFLPGKTADEPNPERQAVGVETNAPAFDFDNDPSTPPTTTNPNPFNENALREETGTARRDAYFPPDEG